MCSPSVSDREVLAAVDGAEIKGVGSAFAAKARAIHRYERKSVPRWLYNLYTMLHGGEGECHGWAALDSCKTGTDEYVVLFTRREPKQTPGHVSSWGPIGTGR